MTTAIGAYATQTALAALIGQGQTFDPADVALQGVICDRVNGYIESATGIVIAPVSSAVYTFDGDGTDCIYYPRGVRSVTLLEIADYTGGSYTTETATNYVIRPAAHDRIPGFPATEIRLTDQSTQHRTFPVGYDTVRVTMTTGWAAIPDEVTNLALAVAMRAWNARQSGYQNVDGIDENGRPVIARFFLLPDYQVLKTYTPMVLPR